MTPDGCNTDGEPVRPGEVQNSGSTHPHPEQIDPRDWCGRCGTHVATEMIVDRGGTPSTMLCPVCRDDERHAADRVCQHSSDRGEQQHGAVSNDRAPLERGGLASPRVMVSTDGQHWQATNAIVARPGSMTYTVT